MGDGNQSTRSGNSWSNKSHNFMLFVLRFKAISWNKVDRRNKGYKEIFPYTHMFVLFSFSK